MVQVTFLVDGFNVYHSLKDASRQLGGASTRWLDLRSLFTSYLHNIGGGAQLGQVYYFSAYAHHLAEKKPGVVARHQQYVRALEATGVEVVLSRFKKTSHFCQSCQKGTPRREEKETDVAIAAKLFEVMARDLADVVVLVTGDTDLVPAIRTAKELYPSRRIFSVFPFNRKNNELASVADGHFNVSKDVYLKHQLPDQVQAPAGRVIARPDAW